MHILLIHQAFAGLDEAGGTRHFEMARILAQKGHQVTIIASPISYITGKNTTSEKANTKKQEPIPGITILRVATYSGLHRSFFHRMISFFSFMISSFIAGLQVRKVDLVWGTSPPIFQGFTAWLLSFLKGVPFLFEVRDLWPAFAVAVGVLKNKVLIWLSLWLERFLYRRAAKVVVNSPGYLDHVKAHGARDVVLIPNGVDPEMFTITDHTVHNIWLDKKKGHFIVLYAGAHGLSNDLPTVLQAAKLLEKEPAIRFWLVGDGKEKAKLIAQANAMQLTNLDFFPSVSKLEMNQVMAASDADIAILLPIPLYKTTYPNKVFDYMAAGKPVVLAIDGVIRQVVENANAGIFAEPGNPAQMVDAIDYLHKHSDIALQMGLNGKKYVTVNFNRKDLTEKFRTVIEEMVYTHERKDSGSR
jgi:glycosyltransferase involved in cell wall biosynthesis